VVVGPLFGRDGRDGSAGAGTFVRSFMERPMKAPATKTTMMPRMMRTVFIRHLLLFNNKAQKPTAGVRFINKPSSKQSILILRHAAPSIRENQHRASRPTFPVFRGRHGAAYYWPCHRTN